VDTPVSLVDLLPTVLDLLGLEPPSPGQGTSLVPALRGGTLPATRPLYFSWLAAYAEGVRFGPYKYVRSRTRRSLFRIDEDPQEEHPLGKPGKHPLAERMLAEQDEASARIRAGLIQPDAESEVPAVPEDVERSLRALGYVK
jgi:arylsulfatase A-like enzyme